ncbi:MAG TPA: glycosyltransferase [Gemmatimonadaceae bacterium]|nr:glycosyltransferase [Gemmatimonadaceae bacterium]
MLHVAPNITRAYGGPTYSLVAYSVAARSAGIEITIAAPRPSERDRAWISSLLPDTTILSFPVHGRGAFLLSPGLQAWLRGTGASYDAVHVHGLFNPISSLATRTCVKRGWPVIVRPFGTLSRYTIAHRRGALKRAYLELLDAPNLRRVSALHFTTDVEREESMWHGIEWGDRAFIVPPPWIEKTRASPPRPAAESMEVVFISRLHPVKNVELLLDAWGLVRRQRPNARLTIAGDGDAAYVRTLERKSTALSAGARFVGHVSASSKTELLLSAAVFVLPSLHENFGIAVLEALAAGVPVVITPEVQLSSFVIDPSLGIVTQRTPESLATCILSALDNHALREHCRANGPALVERYFSPSVVGSQLSDMYDFAAAHSPR